MPLTQPREHFQGGISIGSFEPHFAREGADGNHRLSTHPTVGALSVKTEAGEAALDLLHLGESRGALTARELLYERFIAEMEDGECISAGRIVRSDRIEILRDKKDRFLRRLVATYVPARSAVGMDCRLPAVHRLLRLRGSASSTTSGNPKASARAALISSMGSVEVIAPSPFR